MTNMVYAERQAKMNELVKKYPKIEDAVDLAVKVLRIRNAIIMGRKEAEQYLKEIELAAKMLDYD
jgi:hypothetical protein